MVEEQDGVAVLQKNQEFSNYDEFHKMLQTYEKTFTKFSTVDSRTIEKANERVVNKTNQYKKAFEYSRVQFRCKHGCRHSTKITGKRPNQRLASVHCKFILDYVHILL